jgi:hypothetical protein
MKNMDKTLLLFAMCVVTVVFSVKSTFAADPPTAKDATCAVSVTVDPIIEWEGANFAALAPDNITAQASAPTASKVYTLWTNCNVALSADQTVASQLKHGAGGEADTLVTKYKISTNGDGATETGATALAVTASGSDNYVIYSDFLETPLAITHVNTDGAVEITLFVEATNDTDNVADSGLYSATQTITATWVSDN